MGRDNAIARQIFGVVNKKKKIPARNVMLIGAVAFVASLFISYELGANLLNFGALIGFMGVNAAAFLRYFVRSGQKRLTHAVWPLLGFMICAWLWWNLDFHAKMLGGIWLAVGIVYGAWRTGGCMGRLSFEV